MKPITVEQAVEVLNRAYDVDPVAMQNLIRNRVICTEELAEDPTIQVGELVDGIFEVGMLGIINGIFGADENSIGHIAAKTHGGMLMGFMVYEPKTAEGLDDD